MVEIWSKEKIINEIISMLYNGGHLSTQYLQENHNKIKNAIYYKRPDGKRAYFKSFTQVRKSVSKELKKRGIKDLAKKILSPDYKQPIISPETHEELKEKTLELMRIKIQNNENLTLRYQKEHHSLFYYRCCKYYGSYRNVFETIGENYEDHVQIKKTKNEWTESFLEILVNNPHISKKDLTNNYHTIWKRLGHYYGGVTNALNQISETVNDKNLKNKIYSLIETNIRSQKRKKRIESKRRRKDNVTVIDNHKFYEKGEIPGLKYENNSKGEVLVEKIRKSSKWLSTKQVAEYFDCSTSNVLKNLLPKFNNLAIQCTTGKTRQYFFQPEIMSRYRKENEFKIGEISAFSKEIGVNYGKVRSIMDSLGYEPAFVGKYRKMMPIEKETIRLLIDKERKLYLSAVKSIDSKKYYSIDDMEVLGVPTSRIYRQTTANKIPYVKQGSTRKILGSEILKSLKKSRNNLRFLQSFNIPGHFDKDIYTIPVIATKINVKRSTLRYRINALLEDNYLSAFRLTKNDRIKVFFTNEGVEMLKNWERRKELQLINVLKYNNFSVGEEEVQAAKKDLEQLLGSTTRIKEDKIFADLNILREFVNERILIGDVNVNNKNLFQIYNFMKNFNYKSLVIDKEYETTDIENILTNNGQNKIINKKLDNKILESIKMFEFIISEKYSHLIDNAINYTGVNDFDSRIKAEQSLMWTIQNFNGKGNFSAFAASVINKTLKWNYNKSPRSLDEEIAEDLTLKEVLPEESTYSALSLLDSLNELEREIVEDYLGINGTSKTFLKISKERNLSLDEVKKTFNYSINKMKNKNENMIDGIF